FEATIFKDHELGRPILGFPNTVRAFTRDQLVSYIDSHYTPERTVLAVAGNANHEEVARIARRIFGTSARRPINRSRIPVNGYVPREFVQIRPIQQAHLVVGTRGYDVNDPRRTTMSVLNTLLGGGMSSRLN